LKKLIKCGEKKPNSVGFSPGGIRIGRLTWEAFSLSEPIELEEHQ
jgi:hypothetical protein